jgi:hypothetical protein
VLGPNDKCARKFSAPARKSPGVSAKRTPSSPLVGSSSLRQRKQPPSEVDILVWPASQTVRPTNCQSEDVLRVETTGGIGNQRECIVNAILLARLLGLGGLVVPVIHPIWHSHQDGWLIVFDRYTTAWRRESRCWHFRST